jgi:hypothetical protein
LAAPDDQRVRLRAPGDIRFTIEPFGCAGPAETCPRFVTAGAGTARRGATGTTVICDRFVGAGVAGACARLVGSFVFGFNANLVVAAAFCGFAALAVGFLFEPAVVFEMGRVGIEGSSGAALM